MMINIFLDTSFGNFWIKFNFQIFFQKLEIGSKLQLESNPITENIPISLSLSVG